MYSATGVVKAGKTVSDMQIFRKNRTNKLMYFGNNKVKTK
jgi:hypothetical protein